MASLVTLGSRPRRYPLGRRTTLGRSEENTIALADMAVSSHHVVIKRVDEGRYQLMDLGTTNGTFVGERKVNRVLLEHGDDILLGDTKLRFDGGVISPAPPEPDLEAGITLRRLDTRSVHIVRSVDEAPRSFREQTQAGPATFSPAAQLDEDDVRRDYEKLRAALELSRALAGENNLDGVLERIVDIALELLKAERAAVLLLDTTGQLVPRVAKQHGEEVDGISLSTSILDHVVANRTGVLCEDLGTDERFRKSKSIIMQGIRSAMCVPMLHDGELIGVVHMDSRLGARVFERADLEVFTTIATQAAFAVKTAMLEQQLRDAERERAQAMRAMISGASHFINNPLSVITANLSVLHQWSGDLTTFHAAANADPPQMPELSKRYGVDFIDAEMGQMAQETRNAAERIAKIVAALRVFDDADAPSEMTAFDVTDLIDEVLANHDRIVAPVAQVHRQMSSAVVVGARNRLGLLFGHLIKNACDAVEPGAPEANWLVVSTEVVGARVHVAVDDTGRGIPVAARDRVFVPFFTDKLDGSMGLGLPVAAEIARQHGATVSIQSRPGGGTRLLVDVPLAPS